MMINLTIDGKAISVPKGTTVYQAAKQLGLDIPIFCYQDRMPPFGACRVCLVEVEKMSKPQTSCTLEVAEGMVVKTQSALAVDGRKDILEFLLINHPLDCPICDRGGECPLQDQTLKFGPGMSRFFEEKRHFKKPLPLGPVLMLDRERCIVCARCTRFSDIISGDHALEMKERGYRTEIGTPDSAPVKSKFIGNTIMICPVGALTSQVYRFRARPWDNDSAPTSCTLCPIGCSMHLDSRDGEIMRTRSKENHAINDIWLCDKGWFGYSFSEHPKRLNKPLMRIDGKLVETTWNEALDAITEKMLASKTSAGLGGNPLTVEENYFFQKLIREGLGSPHVDHRVGSPIFSLKDEWIPPGMDIQPGECEDLSFALILGSDLTEEFPLLWLRLKAAINKGAKVVFLGHYAPEISPFLTETILHSPGEELSQLHKGQEKWKELFKNEGKGALFVGRQYLASPNRALILSEILKIAQNQNLSLNLLEGRGNSYGARFAGMHPELESRGRRAIETGLNTLEILKTAAASGWDYLHVAGADPATKLPSKLWQAARKKVKCLVVQELFLTETAKQADFVLPTLCFLEKDGHFLTVSKQLQKIAPGKTTPPELYSDEWIFQQLAERLGVLFDAKNIQLTQTQDEAHVHRPDLSSVTSISEEQPKSGTLKATFSISLFDEGTRMEHNDKLKKVVKKPFVRIHPDEGKKRSIATGSHVRLQTNEGTIDASIVLDDHVAENTIVLPLGFKDLRSVDLSSSQLNGAEVTILH